MTKLNHTKKNKQVAAKAAQYAGWSDHYGTNHGYTMGRMTAAKLGAGATRIA